MVEQHAFLDVQFCVGQAFGESWAGKRARIKAASALGSEAGWDLVSIIVKSNDDMRQEVSRREAAAATSWKIVFACSLLDVVVVVSSC